MNSDDNVATIDPSEKTNLNENDDKETDNASSVWPVVFKILLATFIVGFSGLVVFLSIKPHFLISFLEEIEQVIPEKSEIEKKKKLF